MKTKKIYTIDLNTQDKITNKKDKKGIAKNVVNDKYKKLQVKASYSNIVLAVQQQQQQDITILKDNYIILKDIKNKKDLNTKNLSDDLKKQYCIYNNKLQFAYSTIQKEIKKQFENLVNEILENNIDFNFKKIKDNKTFTITSTQKQQFENLVKTILSNGNIVVSYTMIKNALLSGCKVGMFKQKKVKTPVKTPVKNIETKNNLKDIK